MTVGRGRHHRASGESKVGKSTLLRQVGDPPIATARRSAKHLNPACYRPDQSEHAAQQRRLAGPIGAQQADELALVNAKVDAVEHQPAALAEARPGERNRRSGHLPAADKAWSTASSWPSIQD